MSRIISHLREHRKTYALIVMFIGLAIAALATGEQP
jgi:hypothetical protein